MTITSTRSSARSTRGRTTNTSCRLVSPRVIAQPNASRVARAGLGAVTSAAAPVIDGLRDSAPIRAAALSPIQPNRLANSSPGPAAKIAVPSAGSPPSGGFWASTSSCRPQASRAFQASTVSMPRATASAAADVGDMVSAAASELVSENSRSVPELPSRRTS